MIEAQAIKPHPVSSGVAQQGVDVNIGFYLPAMMKVCRAAFGAQSQVSEVGSSAETGAKAVEVQWTIQVANTEIDVREGGESWEKVRVEADERCAMALIRKMEAGDWGICGGATRHCRAQEAVKAIIHFKLGSLHAALGELGS